MKRARSGAIVVLAGGVGAARLLRGLAPLCPPAALTVIVNTADDDVFHGLAVSPDLDTVLYTLAGLADAERGWGLRGDTFHSLSMLQRYGRETWFRLGDRDLATHILRTERLRAGAKLSEFTAWQARALGIPFRVLPMTDDPVRTIVVTTAGRRSFQQYLVRDRARGRIRSIRYAGVRTARPAPGVLAAIERASTILLAPSNPFVSIGPILALPGVRPALRRSAAAVVGISPLIGGRPVKGPADRMMRALGHRPTPSGLARVYRDLLDGLVIDRRDEAFQARLRAAGLAVAVCDTLMPTASRAAAVARVALELATTARRERGRAG